MYKKSDSILKSKKFDAFKTLSIVKGNFCSVANFSVFLTPTHCYQAKKGKYPRTKILCILLVFIVFNYRTDEGSIFWVDKNELSTLNLAEGMRERLPMFLDKKHSEGFGIWNEHTTGRLKWQ